MGSVADQIRPKVPKLAAILDDAEPDVLAYMTFRRSFVSSESRAIRFEHERSSG